MLTTGRTQAEREGVRNIVFQQGDAAALPFLHASFSIVVCRYAIHHFPDPAVQLREMARCLQPNGSLAIADLVSHSDPQIAERQNALERLRDPAHARTLTQAELLDVIADAGLTTTSVESRQIARPLAPWLEQTATDAAVRTEIEHRLAMELDGGEPTGFQPRRDDGTLLFTQAFTSVVATKP
jgi:SAM-dependent methyltransferase